jgi:hypothetical protein
MHNLDGEPNRLSNHDISDDKVTLGPHPAFDINYGSLINRGKPVVERFRYHFLCQLVGL